MFFCFFVWSFFFCFFTEFYRVSGVDTARFSRVSRKSNGATGAQCASSSLSLSLSLCLFIFLSRTHRTTSWSTWPSVTIDGVGGDGRDPHSVVGQPLRVLLLLLPAISHMSPSSVGVSSDDAPSPLVVGLGSRSLRRRSMQLE